MAIGDLAESRGLPVSEGTGDIRLGFNDINALADWLADFLWRAWPRGVNTTENLATTGDVNANGKVVTNEMRVQVNAYVGGQLSVTAGINTNGTVAANVLTVGGVNVGNTLAALDARVRALEAK